MRCANFKAKGYRKRLAEKRERIIDNHPQNFEHLRAGMVFILACDSGRFSIGFIAIDSHRHNHYQLCFRRGVGRPVRRTGARLGAAADGTPNQWAIRYLDRTSLAAFWGDGFRHRRADDGGRTNWGGIGHHIECAAAPSAAVDEHRGAGVEHRAYGCCTFGCIGCSIDGGLISSAPPQKTRNPAAVLANRVLPQIQRVCTPALLCIRRRTSTRAFLRRTRLPLYTPPLGG